MSRSLELRTRLHTLRINVAWGVGYGIRFAVVYCVIGLGIFAFEGSRPFRDSHTTLARALVLYVGGGVAAGAVVGLLRPFTRTRTGAAAVGVLAALPIAAFGVAMLDPSWNVEFYVVTTVLSLGWGIPGGLSVYRIAARRRLGRGSG